MKNKHFITPTYPPSVQLAQDESHRRKTHSVIGSIPLLAGLLFLSGCAASNSSKAASALVCPQCRMVSVEENRSHFGGPEYIKDPTGLEIEYDHMCPNCTGILKTLFVEGKLRHECSACKDSPYTCPLIHPIDG